MTDDDRLCLHGVTTGLTQTYTFRQDREMIVTYIHTGQRDDIVTYIHLGQRDDVITWTSQRSVMYNYFNVHDIIDAG